MPTKPYFNKEGKPLPSVTTILSGAGWGKQQLMRWANKQGLLGNNIDDELEKANNAGTLCHYLIECSILSVEPDYSGQEFNIPSRDKERAYKGYENYLLWRKAANVEIIHTELTLISEEYQYAGTCDGIGYSNGVYFIIDFKTSNRSYSIHKVQCAAYAVSANENKITPEPIDSIQVLRVDKFKSNFTHEYLEGLDDYIKTFHILRELHKMYQIIGD